jgi:hypothetical protein
MQLFYQIVNIIQFLKKDLVCVNYQIVYTKMCLKCGKIWNY